MNLQETYKSKLVSVEEAAKKIESGDKIWCGPCTAGPLQLMDAIADRVDELTDVEIVSGLALYPYKLFQSPKYIGKIDYYTYFYGGYERALFKNGNINVNSCNLSQLNRALINVHHVKTLISEVSEPDEEGYMYYGPVGSFVNGDVAEYAEKIIVQVNRLQPHIHGPNNKTRIHVNDVTWICEVEEHAMPLFPNPEVSEVEQKIANYIVEQIPDGATIQVGIGGLANAVAYGLDSRKNLSVHSEMFTDALMYLYKKGVISGTILVAFSMGNKELYEFLHNGPVQMAPASFVNSPLEIMKCEKFVGINSCLMADLTGQVCSESLGHLQYSSTGGQNDYAKGTSLVDEAKAFLCMASTNTAKDGTLRSTITLNLPPGAAVSVARSDVAYVVTEYGIANIRNRSIRQRVNAMIEIAHPSFRESLRKEAIEAGLILT
ncbi:hypothetical protein LQZ18_05265 [Lachnospiraceae bacterium ZAX-1]